MSGITGVEFSSLFWETLAEHRGKPHYAQLRQQIDYLICRKSESRAPINRRDSVIGHVRTNIPTWHCSVTRNPDVVIFYQYRGDNLCVSLLGRHDDYLPRRAKPLATRIHNSLVERPKASPEWETLSWSRPSDLIGNTDLTELSRSTLDGLLEILDNESASGAIYQKLFGDDLIETDFETVAAWLEDVELAEKEILAIRQRTAFRNASELLEEIKARQASILSM